MKVIILVPILNEEKNINKFITEVTEVTKKIKSATFSFLFIDDGSRDSSWSILEKIYRKDKRVMAVKLSRNFGSHEAIYAGIQTAVSSIKFDYIIVTTIDLQNPTELIPKMISRAKTGLRVVWGVRETREKENVVNKTFSNIYYSLVKKFALQNMPQGGIDYCLIDKKVAEDVTKAQEKNTSIFGLILWQGYQYEMIPYVRKHIPGRKSRWKLIKKIKLFIDTFVSFSYAPIRLVTYSGLIISSLGFLYALLVLIRKEVYNIQIEGWTSLMFITLVLFGVNMIMLGIIAEYLWRTFDSARNRPIYLIDKKINI